MQEFRTGNLVRHKSGGPIMMVEDISYLMVRASCVWTESSVRQHRVFELAALDLVFADGTPRDYAAEN